jgi:predicted enzyme related to lactoylglutathione lyase
LTRHELVEHAGEEMSMRFALLLAITMTLSAAQDQGNPNNKASADVGLGRVAWFDITTTDLKKSAHFYSGLFGWKIGITAGNDQFAYIVVNDAPIGNLRVAEGPISKFDGVVYIEVADIRASSAQATKLGATVEDGFPFDLPDGSGAISLIKDPVGHPIGMFSRVLMAAQKPPAK